LSQLYAYQLSKKWTIFVFLGELVCYVQRLYDLLVELCYLI